MSMNDFKIGKQLGKGAFGSVCIVTRLADQKTYAMKQVKISSLNHKERENALNEIRILASLQHPNIVGYKEAFYDQNTKTINIVMEYADDGDLDGKLKKCIKSHRIFEESQMWSWIIQLLEGLKYLHDNKIIHRDLKCANLFLMKNGLLKIGDLNVSKLNKAKYAQTQTGTPYYCAPEIWEDKPYDYKCDIWSVGCILYELCTHHPPFRGTSLRDLYQNVMKGRYEPISNNYTSDLRNFIGKMLVLDPRKRPSTNDLLNTEIIKKKISETKNNNIIAKVVENNNAHANFIKTIKLPKNLNEINRALPKKRYKNNEREMMENDEFETKKADFFKNALNDMNKNNNNANNNQPINNFNKQLLINKNNNSNNNNYNNNIEGHKSKDNNPIKIKEISRQKDDERKKEEERRRKEEQRKRELYFQEQKQQQIQKQQQQKNYVNNNLINYNGNAEYIRNKNIDIYNRPKSRPESSKPASNYSNNNNKIPSSRQDRYKNLFGDQPPESHHHHHNPPSNNKNNNNPKHRPQSGRIQESHHHKNNLVNDNKNNNGLLYNYNYNSPSYPNKNYNINNNYNNKLSNNNKKKPKVVYEKLDYKKYKQNNPNRFGFNYNKYNPNLKVNNKNDLQKAMGVGDKNHIHRKGPKIVNIKK